MTISSTHAKFIFFRVKYFAFCTLLYLNGIEKHKTHDFPYPFMFVFWEKPPPILLPQRVDEISDRRVINLKEETKTQEYIRKWSLLFQVLFSWWIDLLLFSSNMCYNLTCNSICGKFSCQKGVVWKTHTHRMLLDNTFFLCCFICLKYFICVW